MLNILLTRTTEDKGIWLNVPTAPEDVEHARQWLYPVSGPIEPICIAQAQASLPELQELLEGQVLRTGQTFRELEFLAKCLDWFSEDNLACLAAAAASPRVNTIPEMVNAVGNLKRYRFFPDIATTEELGRRLAESNVVQVPEHLHPYIDFERIGAAYENAHSTYRLPQGYVFYDGLPDLYRYREYDGAELPDIQIGYVFRVELQSKSYSASGGGPYILKLPASDKALQAAQSALQTSLNECVEKITAPALATLTDALPADNDVVALNRLASELKPMRARREMKTLLAAMEVEQPRGFAGVLEIAERIEQYELAGSEIHSPEDYAQYVINSETRPICIDEEIADFVDYKAFGRYLLKKDGVRETRYGLLMCWDKPFPYTEITFAAKLEQGGAQQMQSM